MKKTIAIVTIGAIALIGTATTANALTSLTPQIALSNTAEVLCQANGLNAGALRTIPIMSDPAPADEFGDLGPYDALAQTAEGGLDEISGIVVRHIDSFAAQRNTNDG